MFQELYELHGLVFGRFSDLFRFQASRCTAANIICCSTTEVVIDIHISDLPLKREVWMRMIYTYSSVGSGLRTSAGYGSYK